MLIATQGKSVTGTQQYFDQVLTQGDYYLGQEIAGHWHGQGAEILGLGHGSKVTKQQFNDLLQGNHPVTGKKLTQRNRKDRRPGMDLTFSVPKSVSLAWAINGDERILEALRSAVHDTMTHDIEPLMQRRVRTGKHAATQQKASTGKLIYADFLHKTSRPVESHADPHLHIHAFVINWTEHEGKHYAGEFEEIVRQRPSLQAKFEARLARTLQHQLGYGVERVRYVQSGRLKHGWELQGLDRPTIEKFSRRTSQVEQYAEEHGIEDAERKSKLGKLTRDKKDTGKSIESLRAEWRSRLSDQERVAFAQLTNQNSQSIETAERDAETSVRYALEHHLFRQSTVERHQVVGTALEHGLTLRPQDVETALDSVGAIGRDMDVEGTKRQMITTREVLEAEQQMIAFARDGRGTRKPIGSPFHKISREWLNEQQQIAVRFVLESRDTVLAISGGAGTGKSSLMQESVEAVQQNGKQVFTFAPSTGAREVLEEKGFQDAQTVEHLIRNTKRHDQFKDQVIWIDEAGLVDVRSMNAVFDIARQQNARVVLSGDTRQHASPRRGEAMRLLETEAGLGMARVEKIQRQQGQYRQAIELISRGHEPANDQTRETGLLAGFDLLDSMGKIREVSAEDRHKLLAETYVQQFRQGKSTLVVAPTHSEANEVTSEIRDRLKQSGTLSSDEKTFTRYQSLNLSEAEKSDVRSYASDKDVIIQFHQNTTGGFKRGDRYHVEHVANDQVQLKSLDGKTSQTLPLTQADRFEVYAQKELKLAVGDKIRFSLGGTTKNGQGRISNGRLDEVKGFDERGNILLKNGWQVDRNYGHLDLGYVITSHASQGKDCQVAIAAMGSDSLPAINAKQFYVTASRGREDVLVFVDSKSRVRSAIQKSGEQLSATAMLRNSTEPAKSEARSEAHSEAALHRLAREGRQAFGTFRDRVARWWRGTSQTHDRGTNVGHQHDSGWTMGMPPSLGRSR